MITAKGFAVALSYWKMFLQGVACTVMLSALTVLFGFILALFLAVCRMSDIRPFRFLGVTRSGRLRERGFLAALSRLNPVSLLATAYVELFRATPMVVQILLIYYGLFNGVKILPGVRIFGFINFDRFFPGVVALALNSGAYLCEIIRSGIQSIDGGQTEAARSLGMTQIQNMRFIVLPQAIKNILPAIANEFVTIIKESAICYTIGVQEIMSVARSVQGATYKIVEALIIATALYFCLTFPTSKIIAHFEKKMSVGDKRNGGDARRQRKRKLGYAGKGGGIS